MARAEGDLIETDKPVNPDLELTGLQKRVDGGCPVLFNRSRASPIAGCVTNLFGDMNVINKMFGWKDDTDRTRKLAYALSHPLKPIEILQSVAPCQEVVIENPKNINEYMVPIRHTTYESELTVGSGIRSVTGKHFDGGSDLGYNRMNFRWGNVGTFQISPGSHMWQVVNKYYKSDEPVPITMCFGVPPVCTLLAGAAFRLRHHAAGLRRDRHRRRGPGAPIRWSRRAPSTPSRWPMPSRAQELRRSALKKSSAPTDQDQIATAQTLMRSIAFPRLPLVGAGS